MQGLYAESHGILSNTFMGPEFLEIFSYGGRNNSDNRWWGGEPVRYFTWWFILDNFLSVSCDLSFKRHNYYSAYHTDCDFFSYGISGTTSAQLIRICYLVPRCNSSFEQRSFSYRAPKIWNDIPLSVRQSPSLESFKRNLKTLYIANN